eukprot:55085_1
MSSILLLITCSVIGLNANTITRSNDLKSFTIDYFSTQTKRSYDEDCSLSFDLYLNTTTHSPLRQLLQSNINLTQSILHWIHLRIFELIDSSFLYNTDQYTSNLWNEYYLHFSSISNNTHHAIIYTISICVASHQLQIQRIIESELRSDGHEVAAFIRYKLNKYLHTHYPSHPMHDTQHIDLVLISSLMPSTTIPLVSTSKPAVWSATTYVVIIAICMIITGFIGIAFCIDNKVQNAITDIRSLVRIGHKFATHSTADNATTIPPTECVTQNTANDPKDTNHEAASETSVPSQTHTPELPSTPDILRDPLPIEMHEAPPSDTITDAMHVIHMTLPTKDSFTLAAKPVIKISVASSSGGSRSIRYDYNGNIKQKCSVEALEVASDHEHRDTVVCGDDTQKNTVCYEDGDVLATFKLVDDHELGDTLFSDVVID